MDFAAMRCGRNALRDGTDFHDPSPGVIERAFQALAEVQVAAQKMIKWLVRHRCRRGVSSLAASSTERPARAYHLALP